MLCGNSASDVFATRVAAMPLMVFVPFFLQLFQHTKSLGRAAEPIGPRTEPGAQSTASLLPTLDPTQLGRLEEWHEAHAQTPIDPRSRLLRFSFSCFMVSPVSASMYSALCAGMCNNPIGLRWGAHSFVVHARRYRAALAYKRFSFCHDFWIMITNLILCV